MEKKLSFIKTLFANDSTAHLEIPQESLNNIWNELSGRVILQLKVSSDCSWNVRVRKTPNGVDFVDGWQDFVSDNSLGNNELLRFTYVGKGHFSTEVFDQNGFERVDFPSIRSKQNPNFASSAKRPRRRTRKYLLRSCKRRRPLNSCKSNPAEVIDLVSSESDELKEFNVEEDRTDEDSEAAEPESSKSRFPHLRKITSNPRFVRNGKDKEHEEQEDETKNEEKEQGNEDDNGDGGEYVRDDDHNENMDGNEEKEHGSKDDNVDNSDSEDGSEHENGEKKDDNEEKEHGSEDDNADKSDSVDGGECESDDGENMDENEEKGYGSEDDKSDSGNGCERESDDGENMDEVEKGRWENKTGNIYKQIFVKSLTDEVNKLIDELQDKDKEIIDLKRELKYYQKREKSIESQQKLAQEDVQMLKGAMKVQEELEKTRNEKSLVVQANAELTKEKELMQIEIEQLRHQLKNESVTLAQPAATDSIVR